MSKEKRRVPKLRFPGFTEDWEQRKLGKCVDISTGYPFDSQDFNENGEYLVITNGNIQENTPFVLNNVGNRIDLDDSLKKYILDIDDLLITMDGTVGRVAIVVNNKLVLAQRVCRIKSNEPYYIYQLLSKNNFIQSMNKIGHGGTIKHISLSEISEYQDFYPKSQKERIKISTVLTNCDKLITLHQRKLNNLKLKKKALLQKLFPKNGERYPEIRFSGFTDAWEQRKLNDFGIATGGTSIESEFVDGGTYKVINIGSYSEESVYNDQGLRVNKTDKTKSRILNKYDLTMILNDKTASGNIIGRVLLIDQDNTYVYNQRTERIEVDTKNFLPMFLYHMLNAPEQRKYIVKASQGNTQIYVNWSTISNIDYMIPQLLLEQEKIANLFSLINKDITLHQRKLDHLQLQKKALLQQMFV